MSDTAKETGEKKKNPTFIHLHTHTTYSLLDGLNRIKDLVAKAKEFGMDSLAITDHGNMCGAIEFYQECIKNDIKPIIGMEAYVAYRSRFDKEYGIDSKRYHLTLLAKNRKGYHNLIKLSSYGFIEGYYYKPRIDKDLMKKYSEGIMVLSGCPASEFVQYIKNDKKEEAEKLIEFYIDTFGRENVFIEIMNHEEVEWYMKLKDDIMHIAEKMNLPLVATWDSHYTCAEDSEAHNTLLAINTNNANFKMTGNYSFISPDEAFDIYREYKDAPHNTQKVADMVEDLNLDLWKWTFPKFELPKGKTADDVLRETVYSMVLGRYENLTDEIRERIEFELDVIAFKGFSIYMLIVADLIHYARDNGILYNIRGSVAGSIVTYILEITDVDPLYFQLPFTRFLNKERPTAPDIDMDFADNRRDEVIEYAKRKYGINAVAQIGTFGTMLARGAVRDVARALEYPYALGDKIAKLIPAPSTAMPKVNLKLAIDNVPELKDLYNRDADVRKIMDLAMKIEGTHRHVSVHAAGVVISPSDVHDYVPVQIDSKTGKVITQYDMHGVEAAGLIKFDFLGLRNLSILSDAIERVEKIRGVKIQHNEIPKDDEKTFKMLAHGDTVGVFQLSGEGMTKWLVELKPTNIDDINAMVALYRPGPMESIPEYIKRKYNPKLVKYLDPRMKEYLGRSYGLLVYQDDVMLTTIKLAGYSWLEADKFRKAMGKKKPEILAEQKGKLMKGFEENGVKKEIAEKLWELILPFAQYGFNKAHAASYGNLAYKTAYMKANYPHEFMSAIMTAESGKIEKVADVIKECRRMGFEILPPDINESFSDFTVVVVDELPEGVSDKDIGSGEYKRWIKLDNGKYITNKIRFGLRNIKNFGEEIGKAIIRERKSGGKFKSLEDFLQRVTHKNLNKKSLEALILSGAMDNLEERGRLYANIENMLKYNKEFRDGSAQSESLFDMFGDDNVAKAKLTMYDVDEMSEEQRLMWEKELLGLYVSGHPLDKYKEKFAKFKIDSLRIMEEGRAGNQVIYAGIIEDVKEIITKSGKKMAFVKIADFKGSIECVFFSETYDANKELIVKDKVVAVKGRISERNGDKSITIDGIKSVR